MLKKAIHYITHWEDWHWFAKYVLISPVWLWLCLRARSLWFFTTSNPTITFGGFVGETKSEIYKQLPAGSYPKTVFVNPWISQQELETLVSANNFSFPLVAKPDVGQMGFMFRRIESPEQLYQYHEAMEVDYLIQELITYPLEVSVFYYRYPAQAKGCITGFIKKGYLEVTGDGKSTLKELILKYPRAQFRLQEMFSKHQSKLSSVIPAGETFQLSHALNLSRGGRLISLEHEKDDKLLKVFDDISHHTKHFYYGRYDIRCSSIEELKQGKNFSILEFNGCGAEPHHVYHNGYTLVQACRILAAHWIILFKISQYNRRNGYAVWGYRQGKEFQKKAAGHFRKLKYLDQRFEFLPTRIARNVVPPMPVKETAVWLETNNKKSA